MRKRSSAQPPKEDVTFLAGWMYADLFLAMMVVFLATVSFIPEYLGNLQQGATNSAYSYSKLYEKPMIVVYEGFNGNHYAQIVGSYNKSSETAADAIVRAQQFSTKMDTSNIDILLNASTTLSSTTSVPSNRVVVKFTFATNVGVKESP